MQKIQFQKTVKTPYLVADPAKSLIEIKGRSNPENSLEFYKPLIDWIETYSGSEAGSLDMVIDLEHFNTSTSKSLMTIFKLLKTMNDAGRAVNITWYYEEDDEEMLETAEIYKSLTKLEFTIIRKPVNEN